MKHYKPTMKIYIAVDSFSYLPVVNTFKMIPIKVRPHSIPNIVQPKGSLREVSIKGV